MKKENLIKRIEKISTLELTDLLNFTPTNSMFNDTRKMLNNDLAEKIINEEIDEIELILIESAS